ncbi:GDP-D-glucose phosphorylase 1 [Callorhinchus milii]|uniref:GDP-D-glucose phosphorylase 1 n=1 Tax=Callorhinchus milii TaxID=7868 RepID=A0A4W3HV20_CALMI|nr:GDP-D-glucose phosphorylase 1 [Callorhinchus milii]|eukprot:gi/632938874/ref/XP_007906745.1/ PREDICTED: GDP-D-glucose phosphorylase 1 [Callorhinchus milii]
MAAPSEAPKPVNETERHQHRSPDQPQPSLFEYCDADFIKSGVRWRQPSARSRLDCALRSGWEEKMCRGLFRYVLRELESRVLPGPRRFVAQLNISRGRERRKPQEISSVLQPFDLNQFNFNRISSSEILFSLRRAEPACPGPVTEDPGHRDTLLVINVSPLEYGHVLAVPDPARGLPQVLTPDLLRIALELVFLSSDPGFRVGFNSLGAFASVNHLHIHGYYLQYELEVEWAPTEPLSAEIDWDRHRLNHHMAKANQEEIGRKLDEVETDVGKPRKKWEESQTNQCKPQLKQDVLLHRVHFLSRHHTRGLVLYTDGTDVKQTAETIYKITNLFIKKCLAHNLFVTRGCPLGAEAEDQGSRDGVRVLLWPRKSCFGVKEESAFNVALCELAGHLPIKNSEDYFSLDEGKVLEIIQKYLLPDEQFCQLRTEIIGVLKD